MTKRPLLVLGAGSDIARATAHAFAAEGHPVLLAGRGGPERFEADARDIALRYGVTATAHGFDATRPEDFGPFLEALPETPGTVLCAVGLLGEQAETEGDPAKVAEIVAANFTGPALALEAAAARLAALDGETAVIGIGSVAGDRGRAKNYWYGAAKAGFEAALSGMRQKHARSGCLVMTVKPGFVATAMTEGMDLPGPLVNTPEEIARLILAAHACRRPVVVPWKWRIVMAIIRALPETVFRRLRF